jgi:hypothetical protein
MVILFFSIFVTDLSMHIGKRIWKPSNKEKPKAKIQVYNEYSKKEENEGEMKKE